MNKRVELSDDIMVIDTKKSGFDMQKIQNRRFMYNPKTGKLILGRQYHGGKIYQSHAYEHMKSGLDDPYDDFVRGWVGVGGDYKLGVIHFSPHINSKSIDDIADGFRTIDMFIHNNAKPQTVVRAFGQEWEQPLNTFFTERQITMANTATAAVRENEPPRSATVTPIKLTAKTQKERLNEITEKLEQGIKGVFNSENYKNYLSVMSKFHHYSFRNSILIMLQQPNASCVAGYDAWQRKFNRHVVRNAKGIKIIAPSPYKKEIDKPVFNSYTGLPAVDKDGEVLTKKVTVTVPAYKVTTVFDVSQTQGEPLPTLGVDELRGDVGNYNNFMTALEKISPVPIEFGNIEGSAKGYFNPTEQRIAVREGMSELQTMKTVIHEIAHSKLHNITPIEANDIPPEERKDSHTKEVEAESVAYTVCQHFGIDTSEYSFGYLAGWSSNKELPELCNSLTTIQKTANEIISGVEREFREQTREQTQDKAAEYPEKQPAAEKAPVSKAAVKNEPETKDKVQKAPSKSAEQKTVPKKTAAKSAPKKAAAKSAEQKTAAKKKPSIRKQLADEKVKSAKQPKKTAPAKKKEDLSI